MRNADGWLCLALSHTRERKSISRSLTLVFVYTCREIVRFDHRGDRMRRFLFLLSLVYLSRERMKERKKKRNHVTYFQAKADFFSSSSSPLNTRLFLFLAFSVDILRDDKSREIEE